MAVERARLAPSWQETRSPGRAKRIARTVLAAIAFSPIGCAPASPAADNVAPLVLHGGLDPAIEERILALVPERISAEEVRDTLSRASAPRIIALQGSVPIVGMAPFAEFLIAMGYPADRIRKPDGSLSYSSFVDARELAGTLAWYYEHEGMMPMLIGHSQGGMIAVKVLHELAGGFEPSVPVWNPYHGAERRTVIVDPLDGKERPVVGLKVPYAAAIATGKLPRLLLGQWNMLSRLREIPDTVAEFTGFSLEWDAIAGNFGHAEAYRALGSARVRNVILPPNASHVDLPRAAELAQNPATRDWIDHYTPGTNAPLPAVSIDTSNLLHSADIWYSVKEHWCLEAQRLIRARRGKGKETQ
jgi:pimeloyl-ACP methyl ester carboxylesterase